MSDVEAARAELRRMAALQAALSRKLAVRKSATDLITFAQYVSPDPDGQRKGDELASRYRPLPLHRFLAAKLMAVEKGDISHLALVTPPQHGKTTIAAVMFTSWYIGRHPHKHVIFATYSEDRARDVGRQVKALLQNERFMEVFKGFELRPDSKAADAITTKDGGTLSFIGRGGAGTGKPCDLMVVDDPIKNAAEARSASVLSELWDWYCSVVETRCHTFSSQVIIHTRWTVDDLIGRLCDPFHPSHDPALARSWTYINIPAVVTDPVLAQEMGLELHTPTSPLVVQQFGEKPMAELWPVDPANPRARAITLETLARKRRLNPLVFEALYQGNPTPEDGNFFTASMIMEYVTPDQLPSNLCIYGASDHAVSASTSSDPCCLGVVGVDERDNIWVFPDIIWARKDPDGLVEAIISQIATHRPLYWFAEADLIGRALGPALRRRMEETKSYTTMISLPITRDKQAKAANIQARASLRKVYFPAFAPWYQAARRQMLKFPNDAHDDFVDFLGLIGRGLDFVRAAPAAKAKPDEPKPGTGFWLRKMIDRERRFGGMWAGRRHYASL